MKAATSCQLLDGENFYLSDFTILNILAGLQSGCQPIKLTAQGGIVSCRARSGQCRPEIEPAAVTFRKGGMAERGLGGGARGKTGYRDVPQAVGKAVGVRAGRLIKQTPV